MAKIRTSSARWAWRRSRASRATTLPLAPDKVFVTLKHLTGHGQPENGTNVGPAPYGERDLRENFFPPFEKAVKTLPIRSVMASYNEIDGIPSHANKWLLTKVLRDEWGLQGRGRQRLFRDPGADDPASRCSTTSPTQPCARSIRASTSKPRTGKPMRFFLQLVRVRASAAGRGRHSRSPNAGAEIPVRTVRASLRRRRVSRREDRDAGCRSRWRARRRREAIVLLKNDRGLLPLDASKIHRLAVLGTHARDTPIGGYSDVPRARRQPARRRCRRKARAALPSIIPKASASPKAIAGRATRSSSRPPQSTAS